MDAFEDLEVWKRSSALAVKIYQVLRPCKDYALKDQITRSSISISSNIAEGFERNSHKQFAQYLTIAKGSCGELRSQIRIGHQLGLLNDTDTEQLLQETIEIASMLQGLIKHCRRKSYT